MSYKLLPLEKYQNPVQDLFYWIKHYYVWKFLNAKLKTKNVPNDFDLSALVNMMLRESTDTMDKVIEIVNKASKGITGVNSTHSTYKPFYSHVCKDELRSIIEINQVYIKDYILSANSKEDQATKERYYTNLKKLFNFIQDHNFVNDKQDLHMFNIGKYTSGKAEKLFHTRKEQSLPVYLEPNEFELLNKEIVKKKYYPDDFEWSKQVLIVRLFMIGLLKTSEVINLKDSDFVEVEDKSILELKVSGRTVNLPRAKFIKYLNAYRELKKCDESEFFFCSTRNQSQISNQYISKIIAEQFNNAGIKKSKTTAEVLKNSGMVYLRRSGYSDIKLQKMTGTKAIRTIQDFLNSVSTDHVGISDILSDLVD